MEVISLPELRPPANRLEGNSLCLDGPPLGGCTLLPPQDPVLLHLTFHSISPGFILLTIGSWVGEAANVLTQLNIAGIFKGPRFFKVMPTFKAAIVILVGRGVVAQSERGFFKTKKVPLRMKDDG